MASGAPDGWAAWPDVVTEYLRHVHGVPEVIERLGGMSVARVYRARFAGGSVVVKTSPRPSESLFYEHVAPRLRAAGVPIPRLELVAHLPDAHWLIIEAIAGPLPVPPPDRWQPDPRVLAVLARLHRETRDRPPEFPASPAHEWTDAATESALTCFPKDVAAKLRPSLQALRREAAHLSDAWCWISGDTSPPNWGVREDGSVALFDWELFRRGVPAGDLAPAVPGLPDAWQFRAIASAYLDEWRTMGEAPPWSLDELARDAALAKLATVVMLLRAHAEGAARVPDDYVARIVEAVPPWLQGIR